MQYDPNSRLAPPTVVRFVSELLREAFNQASSRHGVAYFSIKSLHLCTLYTKTLVNLATWHNSLLVENAPFRKVLRFLAVSLSLYVTIDA